MSMLPRHVQLLGHSLRPSLAWLAEARDRPVPKSASITRTSPEKMADTQRRLSAFCDHLVAYAEAIGRLTPDVMNREDCPDTTVDRASAEIALRVAALVGDYTDALPWAGGGDTVSSKLVAVMRDNLIVIAHWMARVIEAIGQPWMFLEAAPAGRTGNSTTLELITQLSYPETVAELAGWESGAVPYDREAVHEALALSLTLHEALTSDVGLPLYSPVPPRQQPGSSGGFWWGLLLGWALGDWFGKDRHG
jgi:hypothetical protein